MATKGILLLNLGTPRGANGERDCGSFTNIFSLTPIVFDFNPCGSMATS